MPTNIDDSGLKFDQGKIDWSALPLEVLEGLARVSEAGLKKYGYMNCLKPFENSDRRFYAATMRHLKECQIDPLAVDEETGCLHGYQAAWNMVFRTWHALQNNTLAQLVGRKIYREDMEIGTIVRVEAGHAVVDFPDQHGYAFVPIEGITELGVTK